MKLEVCGSCYRLENFLFHKYTCGRNQIL